MNKNMKTVIQKRIEKTMNNLAKNNMQPFYVERASDVVPKITELLRDNDVIGVGGSETLNECNVFELLRSGKYRFLDRYAPGLTPEELHALHIRAIAGDAYLSSTNAITESGELYNVDGNSNRVAAIIFGPKNVIIVAGFNKIVKDLDDAVRHVKLTAAPANAVRLGYETYCLHKGECMSVGQSATDMACGCGTEARICCNYVVSAYQRHKNRIKVIIIGEALGY